MRPQEILNNIKWNPLYDFSHIEVWYLHRGGKDKYKHLRGGDIVKLDRSFIETRGGMIPYHRISKIMYKETVLWNKIRD